jgi:hypothetical protein
MRPPESQRPTRPERPDAGERQERRQENTQERQERRDEAREDWQKYEKNRREDWQEYAEDHYDDHVHGYYYGGTYYPYYGTAVAVGVPVATTTVVTPPYWNLPCTPTTVVVGSTTYYRCGSSWYMRAYTGGGDADVAYTMVNPPAGY